MEAQIEKRGQAEGGGTLELWREPTQTGEWEGEMLSLDKGKIIPHDITEVVVVAHTRPAMR